jgi:hypothetical protein
MFNLEAGHVLGFDGGYAIYDSTNFWVCRAQNISKMSNADFFSFGWNCLRQLTYSEICTLEAPLYDHHGIEIMLGDAVHVKTDMMPGARHYAIRVCGGFLEYQPDELGGQKGTVQFTSLADFCLRVQQLDLRKTVFPEQFTAEHAMKRAWKNVGQGHFHSALNNCECFVRWALTGSHTSLQSQFYGFVIVAIAFCFLILIVMLYFLVATGRAVRRCIKGSIGFIFAVGAVSACHLAVASKKIEKIYNGIVV